jgi:hypothetical protein
VAGGQRWRRSEGLEEPKGSEAARGRGDKGSYGSGGGRLDGLKGLKAARVRGGQSG